MSQLNGNGHVENGNPGDVVFVCIGKGLTDVFGASGFPALDYYKSPKHVKEFINRRRAVCVYADDAGDEMVANIVRRGKGRMYQPDSGSNLSLRDGFNFTGKADQFDDWINSQIAAGTFVDARDFAVAAQVRAKPWDEPEKPAPKQKSVAAGGTLQAPVSGQGEYAALSDADLGIIGASSVKEAPIRWLWPYRFAEGEMALLAGDGGLGKSSLLLAIASLITRGGQWPDGSGQAPQGSVVIVSAEDSRETTLKPRLMALGADLDRVKFVIAKLTVAGKPGQPAMVHPMSLQDRFYWREVLRRVPGCKMLIVDPIPSYLGRGVNDAKNGELRGVVEPFIDEVTRPAGVCFTANTHLNKNIDAKTPLHRITGSMAYGALPRNVHLVLRDAVNPDRRLFVQGKCNIAPDGLPAVAYSLVKKVIPSAAGEIETSFPEFEAATVQVDLHEMMNAKAPRRGPAPQKTTHVARWLLEYLRNQAGPSTLRDVFSAAGAMGFVGVQRPNKDGYMQWSIPGTLYRAKDEIAKLEPPDDGWDVDDTRLGRQVYWNAFQVALAPAREYPLLTRNSEIVRRNMVRTKDFFIFRANKGNPE